MDLAVYYGLLIAVFSGWAFRARVRQWAAGAMVAAVIPCAGFWWKTEAASQMTVLPMGAGIHVRHEGEWLVDCGDLHSGRHITKPFLQVQGINRLPHLVLTHGDVRHVDAAPVIHQIFAARNIYTSRVRFRSRPYRLVQEYFRTNGIATKFVLAGERLGMWEVLHPDEDTKFSQADDNAIVLLGTIHKQRVLLLSDLGVSGQNALIERHPDLQADIVVTGLPRESEPVADGFLDVIQPRIIVIADGESPAQERASARLRARLAKRGIRVIYTSDSGAATFTFTKSGHAIRTMGDR